MTRLLGCWIIVGCPQAHSLSFGQALRDELNTTSLLVSMEALSAEASFCDGTLVRQCWTKFCTPFIPRWLPTTSSRSLFGFVARGTQRPVTRSAVGMPPMQPLLKSQTSLAAAAFGFFVQAGIQQMLRQHQLYNDIRTTSNYEQFMWFHGKLLSCFPTKGAGPRPSSTKPCGQCAAENVGKPILDVLDVPQLLKDAPRCTVMAFALVLNMQLPLRIRSDLLQ